MLLYAALLAPVTVMPAIMGFGGLVYGLVSTLLAGTFFWLTYKVWAIAGADEKLRAEKYLFGFSIFFLFALFATLLAEAIVLRTFGLSFTLGDVF